MTATSVTLSGSGERPVPSAGTPALVTHRNSDHRWLVCAVHSTAAMDHDDELMCREDDLFTPAPPPPAPPAPAAIRRALTHEICRPQSPRGRHDAGAPFAGMYDGPSFREPSRTSRKRGRPIDLKAVDDSDTTGWLSSAVRPGDVNDFRTAKQMVRRVLERAGDRPLGHLQLDDHGAPGLQEFGDDDITAKSLEDPEIRATFEQLRDHFAADGMLELGGCRVAKGRKARSCCGPSRGRSRCRCARASPTSGR